MRADESEAPRGEVIESLLKRNVGRPVLAMIDGNPALETALRKAWPSIDIQRCTNHKLWNLLAQAPAHLREELAERASGSTRSSDDAPRRSPRFPVRTPCCFCIFGLLRSGQIVLQRIVEWKNAPAPPKESRAA